MASKLSPGLQKLYGLNEGDVVLVASKREIPVGLRIKNLSESMAGGIIPSSVSEQVLAARAEGKEPTEAELAKIAEENIPEDTMENTLRVYVADCITTLWGEPVEMTAEDTHQFTDAEMTELLGYCMRKTPLPGKE